MVSALYTVTDYPLDLGHPVFAQYPAMKFGHRPSTLHYARALAPLAMRIVQDAPPENRRWVLTSAPREGLPCGAALISRALHGILRNALPDDYDLRFDFFSVMRPRAPIADPDEFRRRYEYSRMDFQSRQSIWPDRDREAQYDLAVFRNRRVLFVNDINVTGSQLGAVTAVMEKAPAASLDFLMIVDVAPEIGRAHAHLENDINSSGINTAEALTAYLRDADFECTSRLVSRLMAHDEAALDRIFAALPPARRRLLYGAISTEHAYRGDYFAGKRRAVERRALAG